MNFHQRRQVFSIFNKIFIHLSLAQWPCFTHRGGRSRMYSISPFECSLILAFLSCCVLYFQRSIWFCFLCIYSMKTSSTSLRAQFLIEEGGFSHPLAQAKLGILIPWCMRSLPEVSNAEAGIALRHRWQNCRYLLMAKYYMFGSLGLSVNLIINVNDLQLPVLQAYLPAGNISHSSVKIPYPTITYKSI